MFACGCVNGYVIMWQRRNSIIFSASNIGALLLLSNIVNSGTFIVIEVKTWVIRLQKA
jgi:hypothetical protein